MQKQKTEKDEKEEKFTKQTTTVWSRTNFSLAEPPLSHECKDEEQRRNVPVYNEKGEAPFRIPRGVCAKRPLGHPHASPRSNETPDQMMTRGAGGTSPAGYLLPRADGTTS